MGKIAFVFAGQGTQHPGMGLELAQSSPAAAEVFQRADAIRPGTSEMCFFGTDEALRETKNTQPCMFAVELAGAAALTEHGIRADFAAGFSLGELSALAYAGAGSPETLFRLVCRRGELMQADAERCPAQMAAVVRLENAEVERICRNYKRVYPVNYNCPGQVSVSGDAEEMAAFALEVKAAGGRALPLKVRGGFHSPFMDGASAAFALELAQAELGMPSIPVYSNRTAAPYTGDIRALLSAQINHPVRWEESVRAMLAGGADTFIELGPGKTLSGMIARIAPEARSYSAADRAGLERIFAEVAGC